MNAKIPITKYWAKEFLKVQIQNRWFQKNKFLQIHKVQTCMLSRNSAIWSAFGNSSNLIWIIYAISRTSMSSGPGRYLQYEMSTWYFWNFVIVWLDHNSQFHRFEVSNGNEQISYTEYSSQKFKNKNKQNPSKKKKKLFWITFWKWFHVCFRF